MPAILELPQTLRTKDGDRFNIAADARSFDCKFLEPGFVSYRDTPGGKLELLRKETIERCMPTVVGNAVTLQHAEVTPENRTELENGIVKEWYYNSEDGWFWVKGTIDTEQAKSRINAGQRPSCGYKVLALGAGGVDHGIRYDQEITDLCFNHLAIVERPRYADAQFRLNSYNVSNPTMKVFKFLKKLVTPTKGADDKPITHEPRDISADTEIEIDGQKVRLNELFDAYMAETAEALTATPEDALEISGKVVTMGALTESFRKNKARANAITETPEQKAKREADAAKKKIEDEELASQRHNTTVETAEEKAAAAKKKLEDEEAAKRTNGITAFTTLNLARSAPVKTEGGYSTTSGSLREKCAAGAKRY
jgi:hypothetical protein